MPFPTCRAPRLRLLVLLALTTLLSTCGEGTTEPPVTVAIDPTTATIARGDTRQLSASVTGSPNTALAWRTSAAGVATVSGSGLVTGVAPGEVTITAISLGDTLARATAQITVTQGPPAALTDVGGNGQTGTLGTQLPNALAVRVSDRFNNPVSGVTVTWTVTGGGGSINPAVSTSDAQGIATARLTLGATIGQNSATATAAGAGTATFTASGITAPSVTSAVAAGTSAGGAMLRATVNPNGAATQVFFEWGTNSTLTGAASTAAQAITSGTTDLVVSAQLQGLTNNTTYYYRVVATNAAGTTRGIIHSFITPAPPPPAAPPT